MFWLASTTSRDPVINYIFKVVLTPKSENFFNMPKRTARLRGPTRSKMVVNSTLQRR